jgi:HPr kinase/phosphorylase
VQAAEATGTPLFVSGERTSRTINLLHGVLDEKLAPTTTMHGVLVDVFGIGLLLVGKSGIGKSECAVELVLRGHRLVADDVVRCEWRPPGMVFGQPADILRHHVEVRGLGVLNIKDLFGVTAVRDRKRIDIVVQLDEWNQTREYDRLGVDDRYMPILGTSVRLVTVPVRPGRDMGAMLEMAARNELLRRAGKNSARELLARLEENAGLTPEVALDDVDARGPAALSSAAVGGPPPPPNSSIARPGLGWGDDRDVDRPPSPPPPRPAYDRNSSSESSAWIPAVRPKEQHE